MKFIRSAILGAVLVPATVSLNLHAASGPAGYIDFGGFTPPQGGEYVEVNVSSSLISLASRLVEKDEPDVAKLLKGLHQVRVNVVGLDDQNREDLEHRVQKIRKDLDAKGWDRIVLAKKDTQDVSVSMKIDREGAVQGLAVVVLESNKEAVFVNIVGDIKPEQISTIGEKLHIDALKKAGAHANKE